MISNAYFGFFVLIYLGGFFGACLAQFPMFDWVRMFKEIPFRSVIIAIEKIGIALGWPFWVASILVERTLMPREPMFVQMVTDEIDDSVEPKLDIKIIGDDNENSDG